MKPDSSAPDRDHESLFLPELATLTRVTALTSVEKAFELRFESGRALGNRPGQFVEVSVFGVGEAPISVTSPSFAGDRFELAVRKVGSVTAKLHTLGVGASVGIRGPFGNGFPIEEMRGHDLLLVAGGIGLFPLRSLLHYVLTHRDEFGRVILLFGAKSPRDMFFEEEREAWRERADLEYHETVDRRDGGWTGNVGVITTLFPKIRVNAINTYAAIVGPPIMYKFVIRECQALRIPRQQIVLSLERRMKCGVGKCGHCQMNHSYVCQDGPVYAYDEVGGMSEAI